MNKMLPIDKYVFIISVMRMEIKLQPQFNSSIYLHFTQKSKQAFYCIYHYLDK